MNKEQRAGKVLRRYFRYLEENNISFTYDGKIPAEVYEKYLATKKFLMDLYSNELDGEAKVKEVWNRVKSEFL